MMQFFSLSFFDRARCAFGSEILSWDSVQSRSREIVADGGSVIDVAPVTPVSFDGPVQHRDGLVAIG